MNRAQRRQRVQALLDAARGLDTPGLRQRLAQATGLHPRGVMLALGEHLELQPRQAELESLLERAGEAPRVHVVLSANVFTAGLRALCLAVAAAPHVHVRCSRRENVFVPALLQHARVEVELVDRISPAPGDEVHLYGSDRAMTEICASLPPDVRVRAHGSGMGVALVWGGDEAQACALARDIVPFDQQGCLSPRLAFVQGAARDFGAAVASELRRLAESIPIGQRDAAGQQRFRATAAVAGECFEAGPGVVVVMDKPWVAPAARNLVVVPCGESGPLLGELARHVAALGVHAPDAVVAAVRAQCPGARSSALGSMQKPPLDGPVDLRHPDPERPDAVLARLRPAGP